MAAKKAKAAEPAPPLTGFDDPATQRVLTACSSITSVARTAVAQATASVTPFLSFAQRSRIGALAVNFDARVTGPFQDVPLPAPRPAAAPITGGEGGLSRDEIDAMIAHRVEIALTEALQRIGVAPGSTLSEQIDNRIGGQVSDQESRILDYVRTQLTDSLRIFEERLDERLGKFEAARRDEKVDEQLEQAREDLLKNIDEVRTVEVSADTYTFAAGIVEVDRTTGTHPSLEHEEILTVGDEVDEVIDGAPYDEVEVEAVESEVEAQVHEGEVEAEAYKGETDGVEVEQDDSAAEEQDAAAEPDLGDEDLDEIDIEPDSMVGEEIELEPDSEAGEQIATEADAAAEEGEADLGLGTLDQLEADETESADGEDGVAESEVKTADEVDEESAEGAVDADIELGEDDIAVDEEIEELSIVQPIPEEAGDDGELPEVEVDAIDLDEGAISEADEDDIGLMTLGQGPDEIQVPDEKDDEVGNDVDVDLDESAIEEADGPEDIINKHMDRAMQMGSRQQFKPALELYSKVLKLDANHFDALVSRGVIYSKTKDYRKATEDFRQAQEIAPERAGAYYGLAELHYNRRQFNKAIKNYNLALERDDQLAEAYCRRGLSYYYLKNYKVAFHDLYKAYDINPDLPKIRSFLKLVQSKIKETEG